MVQKEEIPQAQNIPKIDPNEISQEEDDQWEHQEYDKYYEEDFSKVQEVVQEEEVQASGVDQKIKEQMLLADSRTQRERINKVIKELGDLKGMKDENAQRKKESLETQLAQLLQIHFCYSEELVGYIRKMFSP